jgi:hypothetical protein
LVSGGGEKNNFLMNFFPPYKSFFLFENDWLRLEPSGCGFSRLRLKPSTEIRMKMTGYGL